MTFGDVYNEANWYQLNDDGSVSDQRAFEGTGTRGVFVAGGKSWLRENSVITQFFYILRDTITYHIRKSGDRPHTLADGVGSVDMDRWLAVTTNVYSTHWVEPDSTKAPWSDKGIARAREAMTLLRDFFVGKFD